MLCGPGAGATGSLTHRMCWTAGGGSGRHALGCVCKRRAPRPPSTTGQRSCRGPSQQLRQLRVAATLAPRCQVRHRQAVAVAGAGGAAPACAHGVGQGRGARASTGTPASATQARQALHRPHDPSRAALQGTRRMRQWAAQKRARLSRCLAWSGWSYRTAYMSGVRRITSAASTCAPACSSSSSSGRPPACAGRGEAKGCAGRAGRDRQQAGMQRPADQGSWSLPCTLGLRSQRQQAGQWARSPCRPRAARSRGPNGSATAAPPAPPRQPPRWPRRSAVRPPAWHSCG